MCSFLWKFWTLLLCHMWPVVLLNSCGSKGRNVESQNPLPYALSPIYLQFLAKQERKIYGALSDYTKALEKRIVLLKRYTSDYEESSTLNSFASFESEVEDGPSFAVASNPILSFRMLSRYTNEFQAIGENIAENAEQLSFDLVNEAKGIYDFPSDLDCQDAIDAILRMQFTYDLPAIDIANGFIIPGSKSNVGLTPSQCYKFAKTAESNDYFTLALDWLNATKVKLDTAPTDAYGFSGIRKAVEADVANIVKEHNMNFKQNYGDLYEHIFSEPLGDPMDNYKPPTLRSQLMQQYKGILLNESDPNYFQSLEVNHLALCNGENYQKEKTLQKLRCWYDRRRHPYWTINPLKLELVNNDPPIVQIFDIVNDDLISHLKKLAGPNLERAPMGPNATPRTAAYAWFKDNDISETYFSARVEFITGLNVVGDKASEALQVAAYAFGGHVELHYDSRGPEDRNQDPKGDRVATFLVYLNDVDHGGLTTFPMLGFSVKPIKGSALLWYTNLRNGNVDPKTLHGACPLKHGNKWIATKWTHSNENVFKRPCGLDPMK